jgi:hypothetical protein
MGVFLYSASSLNLLFKNLIKVLVGLSFLKGVPVKPISLALFLNSLSLLGYFK